MTAPKTALLGRSHFSLQDGVNTVDHLVDRAKKLGYEAVGLVDTDTVHGALGLYKACGKAKMRPIYGATVSIWTGPERATEKEIDRSFEVILLVQDPVGWANLCRLLSSAHRQIRAGRARLMRSDLSPGLAAGLQAVSGDLEGVVERATETDALWLKEVFGTRLHLMIADQGRPGQADNRQRTHTLGERLGIARVAGWTNRGLDPEDVGVLDIVRSIAADVPADFDGSHRWDTDQIQLLPPEEFEVVFREDPEAVAAIDRIASSCTFQLSTGTFHFPKSDPPANLGESERFDWYHAEFPPPKAFGALQDPGGQKATVDRYFEAYSWRGLERRFIENPELLPHRDRYASKLEEELTLIEKMGFPSYMLIVAEFINAAKDAKIPVGPGRGSVAGSLVAYAMRITECDPIVFELYFERFLNPARISMPDIDVDFGQARRGDAIAHVERRYGQDCVGQIATFGTYKLKAAVKDASKSLRVNFRDAQSWCNATGESDTMEEALQDEALLQEYQGNPILRRVLHLANALACPHQKKKKPDDKMHGLVRQTGVHAAGVVLTPKPLETYLPVRTDPEDGRRILETDMSGAETLGLVKFDFLGLKTLDVIEQTLDTIEKKTGKRPDLDRIPLHDDAVFALLGRGETLGLFQVESEGLRDLMRRLQPDTFEDVIAALALYRPGPLSSGMVDDFVERKHGRAKVKTDHPLLDGVLKQTYGIIVYQEQAMKAAQVLAGYSLAEADLLRRAMGKKKADEMAAQKARFVSGCEANAIGKDLAIRIFEILEGFSAYAFNRAHSAAYALITWRTAWLKTHYRAEFMAAAMTWENDAERLAAYIQDARSASIPVLSPDIRHFGPLFTVTEEGTAIRFGFGAIKGLGEAALGPLVGLVHPTSAATTLRRIHRLPKGTIVALAESGALDAYGTREGFLSLASRKKGKNKNDVEEQEPLFGARAEPLPSGIELSFAERMTLEHKALGVYLSGHPLDAVLDTAMRLRSLPIEQLKEKRAREAVTVVGFSQKIHRIVTRTNETMTYVLLSDKESSTEFVVFPYLFPRVKDLLVPERTLVVRGALDKNGAEGKLIADDIEDLHQVRRRIGRGIDVVLDVADLEGNRLDALVQALETYRGDRPVRLHLEKNGIRTTVQVQHRVDLVPELFDAIDRIARRPAAAKML